MHPRLLSAVSEAVYAFYSDMKVLGKDKDVVITTWWGFGRRVPGNGSNGTDHGAAAPAFAIGAPVAGGLHGPPVDLGNLYNGNLSFTTDFRSVYATILEDWLGTPSEAILGGRFPKLPIFG
ncbi:MAG: DUF1501 domain-containing protein [Chloroflexi bacterium]|nr:DUF1501 domain-containing protein [Chloroflexota bacterium]